MRPTLEPTVVVLLQLQLLAAAAALQDLDHQLAHPTPHCAAMQPCSPATKAPSEQHLVHTPAGTIEFGSGLCLASRGASASYPGDVAAEPCSQQRSPNQVWTLEDGKVRSALTQCGGVAPCCLAIRGGSTAVGTRLQLCGCSQRAHGCSGADRAQAGLAMHLRYSPRPGNTTTAQLVSNVSELCVTSFSGINCPAVPPPPTPRPPVQYSFRWATTHSDGMVLQAAPQQSRVWGFADVATTTTVRVCIHGVSAGGGGDCVDAALEPGPPDSIGAKIFTATLPMMQPSATAYNITATAQPNGSTIVLKSVV